MDFYPILLSLLIAFILAELSTFSTTIYLHRCLTHQALKLHPALAFLMHFQLCLGTGIVPREWAAVHRKHHRFLIRRATPIARISRASGKSSS